jgi:hypothetical protein
MTAKVRSADFGRSFKKTTAKMRRDEEREEFKSWDMG